MKPSPGETHLMSAHSHKDDIGTTFLETKMKGWWRTRSGKHALVTAHSTDSILLYGIVPDLKSKFRCWNPDGTYPLDSGLDLQERLYPPM